MFIDQCQLSCVICGGASRKLSLKDAAPKAHPKMTANDHFFTSSQTATAAKNSKMSKGASLARHRDEAWNDGLNKIERTART
jgi:hypothetical protein